MILRLLRQLHNDDGGQILPIVMIGLFPMVLLLAMILNTGASIVDRTKTQNAADAAAITQASWGARSLNVMAMNNVGETQMMSVMLISAALQATILDGIIKAGLQLSASLAQASIYCTGALILYKVCYALKVAAFTPVPAAMIAALLNIQRQYRPDYSLLTSRALIAAFEDMNRHIVKTFPKFTGTIAKDMATINDIDHLYFYPCDGKKSGSDCDFKSEWRGSDLPVKQAKNDVLVTIGALSEMCRGADTGTPENTDRRFNFTNVHQYPEDKGPYNHYDRSEEEDPQKYVTETTKISTYLSIIQKWGVVVENYTKFYKNKWPPGLLPGKMQGIEKEQSTDENKFTRYLDFIWMIVCDRPEYSLGSSTVGGIGIPPIDLALFEGTGIAEFIKTIEDFSISLSGLSNIMSTVFKIPMPYTLRGQIPLLVSGEVYNSNELSLVAFARRNDRYRAMQRSGLEYYRKFFSNPYTASFAYAQAELYNPVSYDLYTQSWRGRLTRSRLIEIADYREKISSELPDKFSALATMLSDLDDDDDEWKKVNAH